jgi:flagellar motor switch protein FliM
MDQEQSIPPVAPEMRAEVPAESPFPLAARQFDRFLAALGSLITGQLGLPFEIRPASAAQGSLGVALADGNADGCVVSLELEPFPGVAYLTFGRALVGASIEILLGAPLAFAGQPRETLTELDLHVIDGLVDSAVQELQKSFGAISPASLVRTATDLPADLSAGDECDEPVAVFSAEIRVNEHADRMRLILPAAFARTPGRSGSSAEAPKDSGRERLAQALTSASVELQAVLKGSDIRFRDLLRLRSGMVLALPQQAGSPVECHVNGVPKFRGEMIRRGRGAAMLVQCLLTAGGQTAQSPPE